MKSTYSEEHLIFSLRVQPH